MVTANLMISEYVCICIGVDNQILAGGNQSIIYQANLYAPSNYISYGIHFFITSLRIATLITVHTYAED